MNIEDTGKELKLLQEELASLRAAEDHVQSKIDDLLAQLTEELSQDAEEKAPRELSDLPKLLQKFETEHPELTDSINRVLVSLGNMGI